MTFKNICQVLSIFNIQEIRQKLGSDFICWFKVVLILIFLFHIKHLLYPDNLIRYQLKQEN